VTRRAAENRSPLRHSRGTVFGRQIGSSGFDREHLSGRCHPHQRVLLTPFRVGICVSRVQIYGSAAADALQKPCSLRPGDRDYFRKIKIANFAQGYEAFAFAERQMLLSIFVFIVCCHIPTRLPLQMNELSFFFKVQGQVS
jgi:hypothetical protein